MLKLDPIWQADSQQMLFRLLLDAMSHPGSTYSFPAFPENKPAALAVLATLLDAEVSLADPHKLLNADDRLMLQARTAEIEHADYILCDASAPLTNFNPKLGTLPSPEKSATVILVVEALAHGDSRLKLSGPGIEKYKEVSISGLDRQWLSMREDWNCAFPLGIDFILVDVSHVMALPRTTKVELM